MRSAALSAVSPCRNSIDAIRVPIVDMMVTSYIYCTYIYKVNYRYIVPDRNVWYKDKYVLTRTHMSGIMVDVDIVGVGWIICHERVARLRSRITSILQ